MYLPLVIDITKQFTFHNTIKSYLYNSLKQIKKFTKDKIKM